MRYFVTIVTLTFLTACSNAVSINDLFEMKGCSGPCYERMPCEGQIITVQFPLDGSNVLENNRVFFVKDQEDIQKTIKIEFAEGIPSSVLESFKQNVGKTAYITGHIEGYDLLNPIKCKRAHTIYVEKASDVSFK